MVRFVTSGGFAHYSWKPVALGFAPSDRAQAGLKVEIEFLGARRLATLVTEPLFNPTRVRMRGRGGRMPYRDRPIDHPSVWSGAELAADGAWIYHLSAAEIAELDDAVAVRRPAGDRDHPR